jgi:hypothetical protein
MLQTHLRDRCVDRPLSLQRRLLEGIFGDILPIRLGGYDPFDPDQATGPGWATCTSG